MTYHYKEWTAFTEADLLATASGSKSWTINKGDTFTMPGSASVTLSTYDNDRTLSGDNWRNDNANDRSGQYASVDGERVGSQMYAESYHILRGSDGKTYYMIEIEVEGHDAAGAGDDYFSFYGSVPPAGVQLTVAGTCNVTGCWVDYSCLSAGDMAPANTPPTFTNVPEDGIICVDENTTFVINLNSDDVDGDTVTYSITGGADASSFEIDAHTGELTFVGAPDFENPTDGNGNNTYDVTVTVTDEHGASTEKAMWIKVKDVPECDEPVCIVIEAESMHLNGFHAVGGANASDDCLVKINCLGGTGDISTTFAGPSGTYDLTVFAQDESDGQSVIMVKINGEVVGTINLDQDNNGGGSNNGHFSEFTVDDIQINTGDTVTLWAQSDRGEFVRIDKIELCQDGEVCDEKLDFEGVGAGTVVSTQFAGVTISAQRDDNNTAANDAMIFDSNNPTGGDHDLGYTGRGNILIISEDNDSSDPDDAIGGSITFDFDNPSDLQSIVLLDIEENGGTIELTLADGSTQSIAIPAAGNNSAQTVTLNATDVTQMVINLAGSGAVDDLCWSPGEAPQTASLGGVYFMDVNDNSVQDADDMAVVGGTVVLFQDGVEVARQDTGADGSYLFEDLTPGDGYTVEFLDTGEGKTFVDADQGGNDTIDSDVTSVTGGNGSTGTISLAAGEDKRNVDGGIEDPGTSSLAGRVFIDSDDDNDDNNNGDETGIGGVTVKLLDGNGNPVLDGAGVAITTETNADGSYEFTGLDAGQYQVMFDTNDTDLGGRTLVTQNAGVDDTSDSDVGADGMTQVVTLGINDREEDLDMGVEDPGTSSLAGRVFIDSDDDNDDNNNGDETGIGGVTVKLLDGNGNPVLDGAGVAITTETNADGSYEFTGLDAGQYQVMFDTNDADLGGRVLVDQNAGVDDTSDSDVGADGMTQVVTLGINDREEDLDMGVEDPGTASLGGRYFCDDDDDGVQGQNDTAIVAATVVLLLNGVEIDRMETDENGNYLFENLDAADGYQVQFLDTETGKQFVAADVGQDDTVDSDVTNVVDGNGVTDTISLEIGEDKRNVDGGIVDPGTASLGNKLFIDANGNGLQDDGEVGVDGVTVTLTDGNGNTTTTVTANGGMYLFDGLNAGSYSVEFDDVDTFVFTSQDAGDDALDSDVDANGVTASYTLAVGEENLTVDAGLVSADPTMMDDMAMTCADEEKTVDVLSNDVDTGPLTITSINGIAIAEGETVETAAGTFVTLMGGELVIDGETAYAGLDIGESAVETITYGVSDGQGGAGTADLAMTFCGDANTVDSLIGSLPANLIEYQLQAGNVNSPVEDFGWDLKIVNADDARLDGITFTNAYCLSIRDPAADSDTFATAPVVTGDMYGTDEIGSGFFNSNQVSFANGLAAGENMDIVNWILNEDFEGQGYTGWEVQRAIWEFTDSFDTDILSASDAGYGDDAAVDAIVALALGQDGFEAGVGDIIGVIVDPNPVTGSNAQPFIIGMKFEDYDCIC
ncbi:SdrD B-like domain-containing protein [Algirhabdus cladophorae]|uniref:SdrD B-like domain-containing protein n=1 Tax=Algirhabdus cladophorae TaxID=3377108 RepID=UPI003B84A279